MVTPRPDKPGKIIPDGVRLKNCWFYLASWTRNLQESSRKLTRLCQTAPVFPFVYIKKHNLAQSGQLPSSFLQTSGAGSQIEPAIFWSCSVWYDFVWHVWPWCNHTIGITYTLLKASSTNPHFGTNQSTFKTNTLIEANHPSSTSYANVNILQEVKQRKFGCKVLT